MTNAWAHAPAPAVVGGAEAASGLRLEILVPLLLLAGLYTAGGFRLWRHARRPPAARRWASLLAGLAAAAVALLSPLDRLVEVRFAAHMLQHMLLIAVAVPAVLLADPFPIVLWALPRAARRRAHLVIGRASPAGRLWRLATGMTVAWIVSASLLWVWHLPAAYDAALSRRFLHDLEHLSFCVAALVFWWPVIHPARVVYLVLAAFQTAALGLSLTLAPAVLYRTYAESLGAGALEDQAWGGVIMWGLGGLVDMLAVLVLVHRALGAPERSGIRSDALTRSPSGS